MVKFEKITYLFIVILILLIIIAFNPVTIVSEGFKNHNNVPTIYVINMDKDKERLEQIVRILRRENLKFKRVTAINGKKLTKEEKKYNTTWLCNNFCTPSQIGCFMSHIKAWKEIVKSNDIGGIVMEDDAEPNKDFNKKVKEYIEKYYKNPDIDILLFHCFGACDFNQDYDIITKIRLIFGKTKHKVLSHNMFVPESPGSAGAYYISKDVAKKLIRIFDKNISWHADAAVFNHPDIIGRVAMTEPALVKINNLNSASSSMVDEKNTLLNNVVLNKKQNVSLGWFLSEPLIQFCGIKIDPKIVIVLLFFSIILTIYNYRLGLFLLVPTILILMIVIVIWIRVMKGKN